MARYLAKRALQAVPALFILSIVVFGLLELAPGDPATKAAARGGQLPRAEDVAYYRERFHLDKPVHVRYLRWLGDAAQGDLGLSYDSRRPVRDIVRDSLPPTMLLLGLGLLIAWTLALILGAAAGSSPDSAFSRILGLVIAVLVGTPSFVIGLIALYLFAVRWQIFPTGGLTDAGASISVGQLARHVALPALVLGISYFGWYARAIEASVAETRSQLFVSTARAKGLAETVILRRHVLRASLAPFVAQAGVSLGALVGGAYAVEVVFSWPGLGRTILRAAQLEDYPLVMALVLVTGIAVIIGNLLSDACVALLDPRVQLDGQENHGNR